MFTVVLKSKSETPGWVVIDGGGWPFYREREDAEWECHDLNLTYGYGEFGDPDLKWTPLKIRARN